MAMPALSGLGSAFSTGANPGGFANFMNTVSPYASAAMGMVPGATGGWGNSIWGKSMAGVPQNANYYGGTGYGWTSPYGG